MFDMLVDRDNGLSCGVDLGSLGEVGLRDRFQMLERTRRGVLQAQAAVVHEVDRRGLFSLDGHSSVGGWCRALGRWSRGESAAMVRMARLLAEEPLVATELAAGRLGVTQAKLLAIARANRRCGDRLHDSIELLVRHAESLSCQEFEVVVRRWVQLADADGAHRDRDRVHDERTASVIAGGREVHVQAHLGAVQGTVVTEVFERFVQAEWQADWDATVAAHGDAAGPHLMRARCVNGELMRWCGSSPPPPLPPHRGVIRGRWW